MSAHSENTLRRRHICARLLSVGFLKTLDQGDNKKKQQKEPEQLLSRTNWMDEGDEGSSATKLTHAQVIRSTLVTIGMSETLDQDLDYAAEVLRRAVTRLRAFDRSVNLNEVAEKEKLKAILTLNAMYALEKKFDGSNS